MCIRVRTIPWLCMRAGQHFVAVLGAQQSVLEAVLLKRRVMGPSWLALARPTRTDAAKQARSPTFCLGTCNVGSSGARQWLH